MNDEPSSSASTAARPEDEPQQNAASRTDRSLKSAEEAAIRKRNRENFNKRRVELLNDLLRNLDLLVYAELSVVYYMDCSFIRFVVRAFIQLLFITPKPAIFPEPPGDRPYIGSIFGSNVLCILMHMTLSAPSAGEYSRGYLHGGLAMEFIGQKGPTSKALLLLLDVVILALQVVQLSVQILRRKIKESPTFPIEVVTHSGIHDSVAPFSSGQTVEDEERGIRHSAERERQDDIEMRALNNSEALDASNEEDMAEQESLLTATEAPQWFDTHILDVSNSGQIVIADLDIIKTVREQFSAYRKAPGMAGSAGDNRVIRERIARGVLRWRFENPTSGRAVG